MSWEMIEEMRKEKRVAARPADCRDCTDVKQRKGEWISVEERLPDNGETVLTVDNEGYMIVASWYELGGWFLPVCRANPVTHWIPLPEPPKP